MPFNIGPFEWIVIGLVAVVLFGSRLPELGRMLGRTLVQFKKGATEMQNEIQAASDETPSTEPADSADSTMPANPDSSRSEPPAS